MLFIRVQTAHLLPLFYFLSEWIWGTNRSQYTVLCLYRRQSMSENGKSELQCSIGLTEHSALLPQKAPTFDGSGYWAAETWASYSDLTGRKVLSEPMTCVASFHWSGLHMELTVNQEVGSPTPSSGEWSFHLILQVPRAFP